jgi:hypothetical protein
LKGTKAHDNTITSKGTARFFSGTRWTNVSAPTAGPSKRTGARTDESPHYRCRFSELVAFSSLEPDSGRSSRGKVDLLHDIEAHVRFLVAVPMLIAAELIVHRRMSITVKRFVERGIIGQGISRDSMRRSKLLPASATRWLSK